MFLIGIITFSIINFYSSYEKLAVNGREIVAINSWRAIKNRSEIRKNWESSLSITSGVGVLLLRVFITYTVSSGSAIFVSRTRLLVEKLNETNGEEGFIREKGHQYGVFQRPFFLQTLIFGVDRSIKPGLNTSKICFFSYIFFLSLKQIIFF